VPDCNRWKKLKLIKSAARIFSLILKENPDVIVSTGAAPGYFAVRLGRLLSKKTIWVDSIANAEVLSLSGIKAGRHVDHWLTQWKHLEQEGGPRFFGNVLGERQEAQGRGQPFAASPSPASVKKLFVTVGTDLPFDRLVSTVDNWAGGRKDLAIYAQIGETDLQPRHIEYSKFLDPKAFMKRFQEADYVISHAGMGTIVSSLSFQKPLLVMPRIAAKGEHRNEHQLATVHHLKKMDFVNVADDENKLIISLDKLERLPVKSQIGAYATLSLTRHISECISAAAQ